MVPQASWGKGRAGCCLLACRLWAVGCCGSGCVVGGSSRVCGR